jgi:hypothetical protein
MITSGGVKGGAEAELITEINNNKYPSYVMDKLPGVYFRTPETYP